MPSFLSVLTEIRLQIYRRYKRKPRTSMLVGKIIQKSSPAIMDSTPRSSASTNKSIKKQSNSYDSNRLSLNADADWGTLRNLRSCHKYRHSFDSLLTAALFATTVLEIPESSTASQPPIRSFGKNLLRCRASYFRWPDGGNMLEPIEGTGVIFAGD